MKKLWPPTLVLIAALLGYVAPDIVSRLQHNVALLNDDVMSSKQLNTEKYCLLSTSPCKVKNVEIILEHDTAKPLETSEILVQWPNIDNEILLLSLQGLEMDMGVVKFKLVKQQGDLYKGSVMLPVCVQDQMTWIGSISPLPNQSPNKHPVYLAIRMEK